MMRDVFVNGRFLTHKISGITRFSIELCKELKKLGCNFVIVIPKWFEYDNHENHNIVRYGNMKSHFWEQIELLNFLKSKENPILLNLSGLGPLWYKNKIIAIHDLSFYVNSKWFSKTYTIFYSIATPIAARNSIKVLTVSEFSKGEIIKYLSVDADDIIVIYNAVSKKFAAGIENVPKRIIQQKYILAVSSIDPRKNIQRLINVFNNNYIGDYKLVLVGSKEGHFNINFKNNSDRVIY